MRDSKKPLLVSINGAPEIGVTSAIGRVRRCLEGRGLTVEVETIAAPRWWAHLEVDIMNGNYSDVDVILIDRHPYTVTAARRGLHQALFTESVKVDISILLTSAVETHRSRVQYRLNNEIWAKYASPRQVIGRYLELGLEHYGTVNHHAVCTDGANGRLYAAGKIRSLIDRELSDA